MGRASGRVRCPARGGSSPARQWPGKTRRRLGEGPRRRHDDGRRRQHLSTGASPRWPGRISPPAAISVGLPRPPSAEAHAPRRLLHHRRSGGSSTPDSTPSPLRPWGLTRGCLATSGSAWGPRGGGLPAAPREVARQRCLCCAYAGASGGGG
ncbi:hypothetical protein PVAP13_3KG286700 [Panicum virgatum]|uniref:Uncharacterized protein n=1 Tax=Panicum virgatum TaxID=38727 RepID=A0A8T0UUX6_PANVG|nr:hypothetical protein PVAP13_3KG286700 [Panicum virgatum]